MNNLRRNYALLLLHRMHFGALPLALTANSSASPAIPTQSRDHHQATAHRSSATLLLNLCCQRTFSLSARRSVSHYDLLGITPSATQADVKSAYYRLSMIYHPDKAGQDSAEAVEKFRQITAAYEVLSNYRLRRLYDKGIGGHIAGVPPSAYGHAAPDAPTADDVEEDDPQTKFYKRHMARSEAPHASGRSPIYNFDAWSEAHYGKAFERHQEAKAKYHRQQTTRRLERDGFQAEMVLFAVMFGMMAMLFTSFTVSSGDEDVDHVKGGKKRD